MSGLRQPEGIVDAESFRIWWLSVPNREVGYNNPTIPTWDPVNDVPGPSYRFARFSVIDSDESRVFGPMAEAIYAYILKHPGEKVRVLKEPTAVPEIDPITEQPRYRMEADLLCSKELDEYERPKT